MTVSAFEKWEGLGNDFVLVEGPAPDPDEVRALCDRRRGVGADGVLSVDLDEDGRPRMVVQNADGSRPEMCGNGLRCVAAWLAERGRIAPDTWTEIATDAGLRAVRVGGEGGVFSVSVRMGEATFQEDLALPSEPGARFRCASMGNPHAVRFGAFDERDLARLGPVASTLPPGGTNVELVRGEGQRLEVLVWERGVGPTQACGTGACAVAAVACRDGRAPFDAPIEVVLPGGPLLVSVARGTFEVTMTGPARRAFVGRRGPLGPVPPRGAAPW